MIFVRFALDDGAVVPCLLQGRIGVDDMQHQADRDRLRRRSFQAVPGVLVGQVQHPVTDRDLGIPNSPVSHHNRLTDDHGVEGIGVPVDRRPCIGHTQVRQRCRTRGACSGGLVSSEMVAAVPLMTTPLGRDSADSNCRRRH